MASTSSIRCSECKQLVSGAYDDSREHVDHSSVHEVSIDWDPLGRRYMCDVCICRLDMTEYFIEHPQLIYQVRVEQQCLLPAKLWPDDIVKDCDSLSELSNYLLRYSEEEPDKKKTLIIAPYFHVTVYNRLSLPPQLCIAGFNDDCQSSVLQEVQHWYRVLHQSRVYYYHPSLTLQSKFYERSVWQANLQLTRIIRNPMSSVHFDMNILDALMQLPCFNFSVQHHTWKPLLSIICGYVRLDSIHQLSTSTFAVDNQIKGDDDAVAAEFDNFGLTRSTQYVFADHQRNKLNPFFNMKRNLKRYHQFILEHQQYEIQPPSPSPLPPPQINDGEGTTTQNKEDVPLSQSNHKRIRVN